MKSIEFYRDNEECPTCSQDIDSKLSDNKILEFEKSNSTYQNGIEKANETVEEQNNKIERYDRLQHQIDNFY